MPESIFLNQKERHVLAELDRYVDGFRSQTGKDATQIVVSHRQAETLRRLVQKLRENPAHEFRNKYDVFKNTYRGIPITSQAKMRPYRKRKDMMELPL